MVALRQNAALAGVSGREHRARQLALLALAVTTVAFAAGFPTMGTWVHVQTPHFLSKALGQPVADAKLVRHPSAGTTLRMGGSSFGIRHGNVSFALAAEGVGRAPWSSYKHGVGRATPFGLETVTAGRTQVEQFLTVGRHLGTTTWRWKFAGLPSNLTPRVGDDGYVAFLVGTGAVKRLSQDAFIAPPAILDANGKRIPQKNLHWSVSSAGGHWWLNLRVHDSKLPTPYVIDPIAIRGTATTGSANNTTTLSITAPTGVVANDVMVAQVTVRDNTAISSTSTRFTLIDPTRVFTGTSSFESSAWQRVATASEGGTSFSWTWSSNGDATGGIQAFSGVDTTTPVDVSTDNEGTTGGASSPAACPSSCQATALAVTTTQANDWIVALYSSRAVSGETTNVTVAQDSGQGMTQRYGTVASTNATVANRSYATASSSTSAQASAGSTGAFTATINRAQTRWITHTIALNAATCTSCTWTGGGGDNNWTTGANWSGGNAARDGRLGDADLPRAARRA